MKEIIGKKITGLKINDDQSKLVFLTEDGNVAYKAYGDCCSESWFADITGVDCLIGHVVSNVEEVSMDGFNVDDGKTRQEYDEAYGYKITTDKGYVDIVFRNSSNGYYGGYLENVACNDVSDMTDITCDWCA